MKHLHRIFVALSIILVSNNSPAYSKNTLFKFGNARFVWHDGGIKLTPVEISHTCQNNYCVYQSQNPYIFQESSTKWIAATGLVTTLLRAALVPLEHRLRDDFSRPAEAKKALISLIRCIEELCYILSHPQDEHSIDLIWAGVDTVQFCKHIAALCKPQQELSREASTAPTNTEEPGTTPATIRASAAAEGVCGIFSSVVHGDAGYANEFPRKLNFGARSIMSLLRLLRNYTTAADKPEAQAQKNMYRILLGLQALYSGLKLGFADFDSLPSTIHIPKPHRTSYWRGTAGWTFSTAKWDYDPYERYTAQRYSTGRHQTEKEYFGRYTCKFAPGTPEYDFWFNTIEPTAQPHETSYGSTTGWTYTTPHWDYDPYEQFNNQRYGLNGRYFKEDYFGTSTCKFASGTPEYDFWFNTIKSNYPPAPISIASAARHAVQSSSAQRNPVDLCGICFEEFADDVRIGVIKNCEHIFCRGCLNTCLPLQRKCPICKIPAQARRQDVYGAKVNFTNNTIDEDSF